MKIYPYLFIVLFQGKFNRQRKITTNCFTTLFSSIPRWHFFNYSDGFIVEQIVYTFQYFDITNSSVFFHNKLYHYPTLDVHFSGIRRIIDILRKPFHQSRCTIWKFSRLLYKFKHSFWFRLFLVLLPQ